jgi:hypothetical protein
MTLYAFALFLHIVGALGLFIALGLEWTSLWCLRRATTAEQAKQWLQVFALLRRIYPVSWAAILLPGFYMTATVWGGVAWIGVAFAAMFLIPIVGAVITGRRMAAIGPAVAAERGSISPALGRRLGDPLLWSSIQVRVAIALGIIFLMTVKPGLGEALLTLGVAVVVGIVSTLPAWSRVRPQAATSGLPTPSAGTHAGSISEVREEH